MVWILNRPLKILTNERGTSEYINSNTRIRQRLQICGSPIGTCSKTLSLLTDQVTGMVSTSIKTYQQINQGGIYQ